MESFEEQTHPVSEAPTSSAQIGGMERNIGREDSVRHLLSIDSQEIPEIVSVDESDSDTVVSIPTIGVPQSESMRTPRSRNPGIAPITKTTTKSLKKAESFPFWGSFTRLHSGLKEAFPFGKQTPVLAKMVNRRSSIPGAFRARKRRSTIGNLMNAMLPSSLSPLLGQEDDEDLWYTTVDDFESPIYILERSSLKTSYFVKASVCRKKFVLHEYTKEQLSDVEERHVRRAVGFMEWLRHPNIIRCYGAWETEVSFCIVEEYCYRSNLHCQIITNKKTFTEQHIALNILKPLLDVLSYLHGMGVAHRGIFPESIQFSKDNTLRLSGFVYAIDFNKSRPSTRQGPLDYSPPEVLEFANDSEVLSEFDSGSVASCPMEYNERIDVWQVGVLTYELLHGTCPFEVADKTLTSNLILWADVNSFPSEFSPGAIDFIKTALDKNPENRPTMEDLAEHYWLASFNKKKSSALTTTNKGTDLWKKLRTKLRVFAILCQWAKTKIVPESQEKEKSSSTSTSVSEEEEETEESILAPQDFTIPVNFQVNSILSPGVEVDSFVSNERCFDKVEACN